MNLHIPDWLRYETRHKIEWLRACYAQLHVRETLNEHPRMVAGLAGFSFLLLVVVLMLVRDRAPARTYEVGRRVWFYDLNTGVLFTASSKKSGPIKAPSGPLPDGGPAGLRANVYSYVLDPNEAELFVGFLEKPNPAVGSGEGALDRSDFSAWARRTLIRRIDSNDWVPAASVEGEEIMAAPARPNEEGRTPFYHVPR